jgi:hypothetical protein
MRNTLFEKIENSKPIDFGDIFNKSIELFKKVWLQGFVHLLISILVMIPLFFVMYIPAFAFAGISGFGNSYGEYGDYGYPSEELSVGLMFVFIILVLIISMVASALQFGITAHFYRVCKQVDLGLPETSSYFMFLKRKYLGKVFALAIATFGIIILAIMLCYLPIFYVMVPLHLLVVIFAFNPEYSASDLIKGSFKLGNKFWGVSIGLILVASILSQLVGMVLCFVGIFFTASFIYMPIYFIYKDALGFEDDELENKETLFVN